MRTTERLLELVRLFFKLGVVAFGGPAAHIAMMEDEVVRRRGWLTPDHFLDLVGATNLIPGPNSTEMTMHVGYERAGPAGLVVAGSCFIVPAVLLTAGLAWLYTRFGTTPEAAPFLSGIKPAVIAVILGAVWRLGGTAVKGWRVTAVGLAVLAAVLLGVNEVIALLGGGLIGMLWLRLGGGAGAGIRGGDGSPALVWPLWRGLQERGAGLVAAAGAAAGVSLWKLGLFFLKVGAILYGSGYVLIAFLHGDLVVDYGWLTDQQLLDAIAIGQFTPGPVLSTATFIGYVVAGGPGAVLATVAIFLPSFFFVLALNPVIPKLRSWPWTAAFLDSVNVSALALMVAVTVSLGITVLTTWSAWAIALVAAVLTLRFKVNAAWLVIGGAVAGWLLP
ncbi:MAG: chromate efflux transporter [Gemmatimonadetes bacterium]|uniref:Chromate efflux transporter n=1 Tax=Candidatus Kutchimonas denitrificans TaxID=3056748 RepID=A0AAE4ZBI9_9BACT|nr:chromate efflux transporter [Gemmatimonadota bacterium]NIR76723.1 chromate efflux transporter [Candidatus Kutchimonas denitrificans]NIS01210.1 chromate efflux transporter [Gemmatimonadota bacterium]NIT68249.1 chromate efflux transporter [Gemmatimonadota bacterium]NIW75467.1 chromate efflux transporter [Gemmatimonadota bacterium]